MLDLSKVSVGDFSGYIGSPFNILLESGESFEAVLEEAEPHQKPSEHAAGLPRPEPFSLLFRIPDSVDLPQRIYLLRHERLGEMALFLVPVGATLREAVFN